MRLIKSILFGSIAFATMTTILFLFLANRIKRQQLATFDLRVTDAVQSMRSPALTFVMKGFTYAGASLSVTIILLFLVMILVIIGYRRELYIYIGVIGFSSLLNLLLKSLFHRARPNIHRIIEATGYS